MTEILKDNLQIAIDGLVGSGKSVGAQLLAKKLKIYYLNTGATFRAVAYLALNKGMDYKEKKLLSLLKKTSLDIKMGESGSCRITINGQDITLKLNSPFMDFGSSRVAIRQDVRRFLTKKWQKISQGKAIVMEGRDANRVLPQADLKIFMTADLKVRVRRIWKKYGGKKSPVEIEKEINARDYQDSHRKINPLKFTKDYWLLNTSHLTIQEEIQSIMNKLKAMNLVA